MLVPALFAQNLPDEMIERGEVECQSDDEHDAIHSNSQHLHRLIMSTLSPSNLPEPLQISYHLGR